MLKRKNVLRARSALIVVFSMLICFLLSCRTKQNPPSNNDQPDKYGCPPTGYKEIPSDRH